MSHQEQLIAELMEALPELKTLAARRDQDFSCCYAFACALRMLEINPRGYEAEIRLCMALVRQRIEGDLVNSHPDYRPRYAHKAQVPGEGLEKAKLS